MSATRHGSETDLPEGGADRYRAIASEVRAVAVVTRLEESRTSLLSLANAYERMADAAERSPFQLPPQVRRSFRARR
jgi:hypothetical protein